MKVNDIPTPRFSRAIKKLLRAGWSKTYEYDNFDAWIDYGEIVLEQDGVTLVFKWDNWCEGEVEGPDQVLIELGLVRKP